MFTLYDIYTQNIALLENKINWKKAGGATYETLQKALFIQYVNHKEEFYALAKNICNLTLYPEKLETENQIIAMRLVSWSLTSNYVNELLQVLPEKHMSYLTVQLTLLDSMVNDDGMYDACVYGTLFMYLRMNFPFYGNKQFNEIKQRFEDAFGIHFDEILTNFIHQVFVTIQAAENLKCLDKFSNIALNNHRQKRS